MSDIRFVSIGFGNICQANQIWAVMRVGSAQSRRIVADAKADDRFFDWTGHHTMRSILLLTNGMVCGSAFTATTIYNRLKIVTVPPVVFDSRGRPEYPDLKREAVEEEEDSADVEVPDTDDPIDEEEAGGEDSDSSDFEEEDDEDEDDI